MLYWLLKEQMGKPIKFSEPRQWIYIQSSFRLRFPATWCYENSITMLPEIADIICTRNRQAKSFLSQQGSTRATIKSVKDKIPVCVSENWHRTSRSYLKSLVDIRILCETRRQIMNRNGYVLVRYKAKITQKSRTRYWWKGHKYFRVVKGKDTFLLHCAQTKGNTYNAKLNRIYFCLLETNLVWSFKITGEKCKHPTAHDAQNIFQGIIFPLVVFFNKRQRD